MRCNLMSIWISAPKMLAMVFICGSQYIWGSNIAKEGFKVVPGRFLPSVKMCTWIWNNPRECFRVACQRVMSSNLESSCRAQRTQTHKHSHRHASGAYTWLYLSALGRWLLACGSPYPAASPARLFCEDWQTVGWGFQQGRLSSEYEGHCPASEQCYI
jgi:hypothetical protein